MNIFVTWRLEYRYVKIFNDILIHYIMRYFFQMKNKDFMVHFF